MHTIEQKLKTLRDYQIKYPTSHVGGSIGLMLHGMDLKRSLVYSDFDFTTDSELNTNNLGVSNYNRIEESSSSDFDYKCHLHDMDLKLFTKAEIRIDPTSKFDIITHDGHEYRVTQLEEILGFKRKYAQKGVQKHITDLKVALNEDVVTLALETKDDLPF